MTQNTADLNAIIEVYAKQNNLSLSDAEAQLKANILSRSNGNVQQRSLPMMGNTGEYDPYKFLERLELVRKTSQGKGNDPWVERMEKLYDMKLTFEMMKDGLGNSNGNSNHAQSATPATNPQDIAALINNALDKQAQLFREELRQLYEKQDREKEELRRERETENRRRETEKLIQDVRKEFINQLDTKTDQTRVLENKYEKLNQQITVEKENRHNAELKQLRDAYNNMVSTVGKPKSFDEGLKEYTDKIDAIQNLIKANAKKLGWTEKEAVELGDNPSIIEQVLSAAPAIAEVLTKFKSLVPPQQVQTVQQTPPAVSPQPIQCTSCGQVSTNSTNICDQCRLPIAQDAPGTVIDPLAMQEPIPPQIIDPSESQRPI